MVLKGIKRTTNIAIFYKFCLKNKNYIKRIAENLVIYLIIHFRNHLYLFL